MSGKKSSIRSNATMNLTNRPATPKQSFNSTTLASNASTMSLNLPNVSKPPAIDWTLECDFANSAYYRALLAKDIARVAAKHYEEMIDMQLAEQFELLQKSKRELLRLKHAKVELQAAIEIHKQFVQLQQVYSKLEDIIKGFNVDYNLKIYNSYLEQQCNKLCLKNIKRFDKQEDYDKFERSLQKCIESMEKFKTVVGNIKNIQALNSNIEKFIGLQDDLEKKRKLIKDLHAVISLNLFKNISDKFAKMNGYDDKE